jgi:uncharacterized FlaG/YvyC family protein
MDPIDFNGKVIRNFSFVGSQSKPTVSPKDPGGGSGKNITGQQEIAVAGGSSVDNQGAQKAVASQITAFLDAHNYSLEFIPNQETGRVTIRVLNNAGEVIRQIPPEEIDRLSRNTGSKTGILVNERL